MNQRSFNNQQTKSYERGNKIMKNYKNNQKQNQQTNDVYTNILNIFDVIKIEMTDNGYKLFVGASQLGPSLNDYGNKFYIYYNPINPEAPFDVNEGDSVIIKGYIKNNNNYITAKNISVISWL
jgi:hypothetical protein